MSGNRRKDKGHINNSFSGSARHRVGKASPNSTEEPCHRTSLILIDMLIVTGVAGSNSQGAISQQTGMADPLANLAEILRFRARETGHMPQLPHTDYRPQLPLQMDYRPQSPQMFLRTGGNDGFEDYRFEGADAEATFRSPHTPHTPMAPNTPLTPHGSASRGISGGHDSNASDFHASSLPLISRDREKFGDQKIHSVCIRLFWENLDHPWAQFSDIPNEALIQMFSRFGTKYRWHSQEKENIFDAFKCVLNDRYRDRMKDSSGSTARHIAGSIGFDQHRRKLEKLMGKPPTQYDVFVKTHGTAESKKKYFEGNHENLEYCSQMAKEAQEAYLQGLVNKFGEDPAKRKDDVDVWEESQLRRKGKRKGAIYGIGASNMHFLVDRLRAQVSIMEQQQQQQQMKEQMEMVIRMINMSGNQPRGPPDNPPEDN
ncbi:unnamed protein product [Lactuca virosa]|uniref:Transposase, Ptta/En/Spm, plant n=1 Tax=Lactuca virosa TaxID=75947 RepID=A0AAU9NTM6_9ASTR|nr:unnamed protein product [Lactuca virosa]